MLTAFLAAVKFQCVPVRPPFVPLTSKIVKLFTKIRDQREQTISPERSLVLVGGPAALKDREVFHKDPRPTGADHFSRAVARIGWRPCRPLTSKIVKFFTKIRDQREQTISPER
jgi:hypothetical protein